MDAARQLFDQWVKEGYGAIERAEKEKWQETGVLDFKAAEKDQGPMTIKDRQSLAEALSGFANSDGGIIIWGVDARSGADGVDQVQGQKPIRSLRRFTSELNTQTPQVVSPGVIGAEHVSLFSPVRDDEGFVLTFVPRSDSGPHMAVAKQQHRYYYRSGSSFLTMPSFMVADRYHRRPQPILELDYSLKLSKAQSWGHYVYIEVGIRNIGRGIALYPALAIAADRPLETGALGMLGTRDSLGLPRANGVVSSSEQPMDMFAGGADALIHPGTTLRVRTYTLQLQRGQSRLDPLRIRFQLYCDGFHDSGEAVIAPEEVSALVSEEEAGSAH